MARKMIYSGSAKGGGKGGGSGINRDTPKVRFARRLNNLLHERGWSQSEFTRRVENVLPEGEEFKRHLTSNYCIGKSLPEPKRLQWMAKVLKVKPEVLLPPEDVQYVGQPAPMKMEMLENGAVRLRIDVEIDSDSALKIMKILNSAD